MFGDEQSVDLPTDRCSSHTSTFLTHTYFYHFVKEMNLACDMRGDEV